MFPLSDDLKAECLECGDNASLRCIRGETWPSVGVHENGFRNIGMQQRRIIRKCILTE